MTTQIRGIDPLFQPIQIGSMTVKNRIYMPAMHLGMCENYEVSDQVTAFYEERARGGAGAICVGYASVNELSANVTHIGAHEDAHIPGLKKMADAIRQHDCRALVQLNHAGRYNHSMLLNGKQPVAPSAIASNLTREVPRAMTKEDIDQTVADFAAAAGRVKAAGFDGVEILSGTGYLISEFLSPLTNKREDEYGGPFENRCRFALEIFSAIRKTVGPDYPVVVRMNGNDLMPEGMGRVELREYARKLSDSGLVDAVCINVGWHEARIPQIVTSVPRGVYAYLARGIKEVVSIPVIASHRINDSKDARRLIADDMCDMVAMGRSLIADAFLPKKTEEGRENEVIHCIACAQGCFDNLFKFKHVECLCNPRAGYEFKMAAVKADRVKKVFVIGGGAAGMSAALAANEKGHDVTLFEASSRLGGQLYLAAAPPGREEFAELAKDLATQVQVNNIRVMLKTTVDKALLEKEKPDAVILATGAEPLSPPIPGADLPHVVQAWDVLEDRAHTGKNVVVIGGGAVGVETSIFLGEKGTLSGEELKFLFVNRADDVEKLYELATKGTKNVTLIEMTQSLGKDIGKSTRWTMMQEMKRIGIRTDVTTKALEITKEGVKVEGNDGLELIPADSVVLAAGSKPVSALKEVVEALGISCQVIGDAAKIGLAFDAVHQGYAAGRAV
ncbi:2,4-dienoyl-CoA reductase (NADPH2) [Desulfobotulus alkaliphilus]|uniref:2,4-dienoyl-CoA reductase (NADPH2) n=1 Tax=Desulfobotulus alkaliphilus TaxID=622671 RepID=A0A562S259_9BACT|nr:FAD-dependent oxidoreductase [Desulfobotulus alkaliphilus]TWI75419.1 2,4-dienoyl-CoA reductase (NADPH2) [Desulfobotulus alkaliphilus]